MSNQNYLFVNKIVTSQSLTRSSAKEQSDINSHVQIGRRHRRSGNSSNRRKIRLKDKEDPLPPLKRESSSSGTASSPTNSSTSSSSIPFRNSGFGVITPDGGHEVLPPDQTYVPASTDRQQDHLEAAVARIRRAQQTSDDLVSFATPPPDPVFESRRGTPSTALTSLDSAPYDVSQFANNPIDPFRKSSVAIDSRAHQLIEYYKRVYHPAIWHAETKASNKGSYMFQTSVADVIHSAFSSDVDMYALLACMSSRLHYVEKHPGYLATDEYLGKALASTRRVLQDRTKHEPKSHEEILMVIFHLYATEGYRDNIDAAKIHMRGARTIIDLLGGLGRLRDPQMRELFIIGDGLLSAMTLEPCMLPCEFDPGSYLKVTPPEFRINPAYDLGSIAPALRQTPRTMMIPPDIQYLIDETAEINWVLDNVNDGSPEASKHALRWIQLRSMAIRHRLLDLKLSDLRLDALRGSIVLWIVTTTTLLGQMKLRFRIAPKIRATLRQTSSRRLEWKAHIDIEAWILSLGAMCSTANSVEEAWFVQKLNDLMAESGVVDAIFGASDEEVIFHKLEHLQARFFYHGAVYGTWVRGLAKKMVLAAGERQARAPG